MNEKLDLILTQLAALEVRTPDTRPIWERALNEILSLGQRLDGVETRLQRVEYKLDVLNDSLLEVRADHRDLNKRLIKVEDRLESDHT